MAHDEPLPDTEEAAREIAYNDNRWVLQREPVSWDPIKLLVVSGHSMNKVAERLGVCPSMVKRRKKKDPTFQPMGTVQQRDWLAVVLKRALTLRWARVDPDAGDAVEAALEKLCAWRPTMTTPYAVFAQRCSFECATGCHWRSPDRVDALVWAVDELMRKQTRPKAERF